MHSLNIFLKGNSEHKLTKYSAYESGVKSVSSNIRRKEKIDLSQN